MTRGYLGVIQTLQQTIYLFDAGGDSVNAVHLFGTGKIMTIYLNAVGEVRKIILGI